MPIAPTYNHAIDDAIRAVVKHWETLDDPKAAMSLMLSFVGVVNDLRRPTRAKRTAPHSLHRTTASSA